MPTPKTVSTDINSLLSAANKAAARTALEAETAGAAAAVAAAKQDASADLTAYADAADAAARRALIGAADAATNTGDEDQTSILTKIGDGTRIGAEFMPDALSGVGDPMAGGGGGDFAVTADFGAGNETYDLFVVFENDNQIRFSSNDLTAFSPGQVNLYLNGLTGETILQKILTLAPQTNSQFTVSSFVSKDPLAAVWTGAVLTGGATGTPVITASSGSLPTPPPSHIGQLYRDTTNDVWYRATQLDPPVWELDAGSVTIEQLEALDATAMKAYLASLGVVLNA